MASPARLISCDEAGFSGPNMLSDQPIFAYAANDLTHDEASAFVAELRSRCRPSLQTDELKSQGLRKRGDWVKLAEFAIERLEGRYLFVVMDKLLALSGKAFEYLVEPVVQENSMLFYQHGLHLVVARAVHRSIVQKGSAAEIVAAELEAFMRTFDPASAPTLFSTPPSLPEEAKVLRHLLRFARGYRAKIEAESRHLQQADGVGKWVLDLTQTSLASLTMQGFGRRYPVVELLCDDSKPLRATAGFFDSCIGRTEAVPIDFGSRRTTWKLNLSGPVRFGSSKDHATLQVSDLIAGIATEMYGRPEKSRVEHLRTSFERHLSENHILPDAEQEVIDPTLERVNLHVLITLAGRAEMNQDPLRGMPDVYRAAIKRFGHPARRGRKDPLHQEGRRP